MDEQASDGPDVVAGEARDRAPVRRAGASGVLGAAGEEWAIGGAGAPACWLVAPRKRRDRLRRRGRTWNCAWHTHAMFIRARNGETGAPKGGAYVKTREDGRLVEDPRGAGRCRRAGIASAAYVRMVSSAYT